MHRRRYLTACLSAGVLLLVRSLQLAVSAAMSPASAVHPNPVSGAAAAGLKKADKAAAAEAGPPLPGRFLAFDVSRPFGSTRNTFRAAAWAHFCQKAYNAGRRMVVIQARGSKTMNPYADLLLCGARQQGLWTAAYLFVDFTNPYGSGDLQVQQALQAIGDEAKQIAFMVVDVENGAAGNMTPAERVNRIGQAVHAIAKAGIRPVIYAKNSGGYRGEWTDLTGNAKDFAYLPLWVPRYDRLPRLDSDSRLGRPWESFGGWRMRVGKQYVEDKFPQKTGLAVDENVFDRAVVSGPREVRPYGVTGLVKVVPVAAKRDPQTGEVEQSVKLVNKSKSTVDGPVSLVLHGLDQRVELSNRSGETGEVDPAHSPYVSVTDQPLPPGKSVDVKLNFKGPQGVPVNFQASVLSGSGDM